MAASDGLDDREKGPHYLRQRARQLASKTSMKISGRILSIFLQALPV
jgi:hypothetical protein